jgi:hypothetical protein
MATKKARKPKPARQGTPIETRISGSGISSAGPSKSVAPTARYAFAVPADKDGEGVGIHVSLIPQGSQPGKLNFYMDVDTAIRLRNALTESVDCITRREPKR